MINLPEAGPGRQVLAGLIDSILCLAIFTFFSVTVISRWVDEYPLLENINGTLLVLLMVIAYRFLCLLLFKQTVGMRLLRLVLLNGEEQPLTLLEKALAAIFILYRGTNYFQLK
jgi:uncharacterized RDD family membrane protein YckC